MTEKKGMSQHAVRILVKVMTVICVFTVLSRISASLTVAEVMVESPSAKRIEHIVDGEGVIGAQLETSVQTEVGLLVKSVQVKKGQKVEAGEVLAELDLEDLAETKRKLQEEWEILYLTNQELLETQKKEATKAQRAQERAKEDYAQAAKESEIAVQTAAAELKRAQEQYNGYAATLPDQTYRRTVFAAFGASGSGGNGAACLSCRRFTAGGYFAQGAACGGGRGGKNRRRARPPHQ